MLKFSTWWPHSGRATTLHLQHEILLLCCLLLITVSSLTSMYRHSFGTFGDLKVVLTLNIWLSRHFFFRLLCTGESNTSSQSHKNILFNFNIVRWLKKYCSSGQYFDAPSRSAILAATSGGDHHHNSHTNAPLTSTFANSVAYNYVILPLLRAYFWILSIKQQSHKRNGNLMTILTFKKDKKLKRNSKSDGYTDNSNYSGNAISRRNRLKHVNSNMNNAQNYNLQKFLSSKVFKQLERLWENLPPPQLFFAVITGIFCIGAILMFHPNNYNLNSQLHAGMNANSNFFTSQMSSTNSLHRANMHQNNYRNGKNPNNRGGNGGEFENQPYHMNGPSHPMHKNNIPSNGGSNTDIHHYNNQYYYQIGAGQNKNYNINLNQNTNPDLNANIAPYLINYAKPKRTSFWDPFGFRSINPSAFKLFLFIAACGTLSSLALYGRVILPIPDLASSVPVIESVKSLLKNPPQRVRSRHQGGISMSSNMKNSNSSSKKTSKDVPHSFMVCKITNHCDQYPLLWERAGSFSLDSWRTPGQHGVGKNASIMTSYDSIQIDPLVKCFTIFSVVLITVAVLLSQASTLDKTYLSNMGYVSGELISAQAQQAKKHESVSVSMGFTGEKLQNNAQRRHRKGGSGNHGNSSNNTNNTNSINSIEVDNGFFLHNLNREKYLNPFLRAAHFLFKYDMGHPSTSSVISVASMIQMLFVIILVNLYLYYDAMGYECMPLLLVITGNVVAMYATCCVGSMDENEVRKLGHEISHGL